MIVLVLTKVPASLRGTLSKWLEPIQVGVYVGVVNARVRDALWERVQRDIGAGRAVMAYKTNTELGYAIKTTNPDYVPIDYDGIALMVHMLSGSTGTAKHGFSDASHHVKSVYSRKSHVINFNINDYVVVDVETTGLDSQSDALLSIGAAKYVDNTIESYVDLIKSDVDILSNITDLTGITTDMVNDGIELLDALHHLVTFCGKRALVAYNAKFDAAFLQRACGQCEVSLLSKRWIDLLPLAKRANMFLPNYKLSTVANAYAIINEHPHRADSDAITELKLFAAIKSTS